MVTVLKRYICGSQAIGSESVESPSSSFHSLGKRRLPGTALTSMVFPEVYKFQTLSEKSLVTMSYQSALEADMPIALRNIRRKVNPQPRDE